MTSILTASAKRQTALSASGDTIRTVAAIFALVLLAVTQMVFESRFDTLNRLNEASQILVSP